jgi:sterol desaturase/sphingolipid hydroxylase (fatty acid hydroxylase superfamily)
VFAIRRQPILRAAIWTDFGYFLLGSFLPAILLSVPVAILAWTVHRFVPDRVQTFAAGAPFWAKALAGLVIGDIAYYWMHRWMHTVPLLWRFHAIHHSAPEIDFLVNTRMHPVDMLLSRFSGLIPLYVLGLAGPVDPNGGMLAFFIIMSGKLWGFFVHANIRGPFWMFGWALTTPAFDHWHHAVTPANRNYASMLPWLDRIFGTYYLPSDSFPSAYGSDNLVSDNISDQLLLPFLQNWPIWHD